MKTRDMGCRVCFDDGFRGIWDSRERFLEQKVRPTVFLAVRLVGQPGYLTWGEIRRLEHDFGFVFQCHTWSHQTLAGPMIDESPKEERTVAWFRRELVESKIEIANQLGHDVSELCFPVGYFNDDVIRRCQDAGYVKVYSSIPGNAGTGVCGRWEGYVEPRCLCQFLSTREFEYVLGGGMNLLARRYFRMHYVSE